MMGPRVPTNIDVLVCELCQGGHHEDQIILCDGCDKGFHMFCLNPPLDTIPAGEWKCPMCLGQAIAGEDAVVRAGVEMTCAEFEKQAMAAKKLFWGGDVRARKVCRLFLAVLRTPFCSHYELKGSVSDQEVCCSQCHLLKFRH